MESKKEVKRELAELFSSYSTVLSVVEELRDEGVLNPHDCDNVLGHLKSGMIEDVLTYARSYLTQNNQSNAKKLADEYLLIKATLEEQKLSPEDVKEVLGLFFKK